MLVIGIMQEIVFVWSFKVCQQCYDWYSAPPQFCQMTQLNCSETEEKRPHRAPQNAQNETKMGVVVIVVPSRPCLISFSPLFAGGAVGWWPKIIRTKPNSGEAPALPKSPLLIFPSQLKPLKAEPILNFSAKKNLRSQYWPITALFEGTFSGCTILGHSKLWEGNIWQIHSEKSQSSLNVLIGWRPIRPLRCLSNQLRIEPHHHDWFSTKMVVMVLAARTEACFWAILWGVFVADIHGWAFCGDWIFHMLAAPAESC